MHAFSGAVALGYRWLETDLHLTADGVVVCLHDDRVDRTTDGAGAVWDLAWDEVRSLDAGYRHVMEGDHPFRGRGIGIPTLEEVATTFPDVRLVVDLKQDGLEAPLAALVDRLDLWDRLIVGSFGGGRLVRFRRETAGRVATSTGPVETLRAWRAARRRAGVPEVPADAVQVPRSYRGLPVVSPKTVDGFHRGGLDVHVWTVNDQTEMTRLLDWGVDGVITDRPDLLKDVLVGRGEWAA
jgi:glycerophosphoryl diester phosphodiesterase